MIRVTDLPDMVPIFPLPGALLLPRARLPLHIFEPRYLAMLDDVLKSSDRMIGMIQPDMSHPETPDGPALLRIGCAGRVTQFSEADDGRYFITLSGASRFRITEEITGFAPYRRARVDWQGFEADLGPVQGDPGFDRHGFMKLLDRYLAANSLETDWESLEDAEDEMLVNSLSILLKFDPEDKQALLEAPTLTDRRETLVTLVEYALRGGDDTGRMQ